MVYNLWVYVYWFVYKTHFRHTVALVPENVAVRGLKKLCTILLNKLNLFFFKINFSLKGLIKTQP